ncbi:MULTISPECIES: glutamate decarboxylase [Serratia]|jgi:glutamate decarboxylase|uniref:Glutamate decarboxylase n=3 Tax=Bacteria TaxID=2 RepID=A0A515D3Q2_SERLI|nr:MULTISPECIES: glutamate decarboxylase [Serratia]AYO40035.1 glutamate decarboxylase [Serratia sp. P2ACOL2]MBB1581660.1 glutamate decarboxylase [Serratia sp. OS31]MBI6164128.1 glutamate decarboxylase [Serratia liquefaciens]MBV0843624.1 glutamate decarboxylase [Serratia liquefaciens]NLU15740.1 glutamate decarboxylase [Serratia liquefaciens]
MTNQYMPIYSTEVAQHTLSEGKIPESSSCPSSVLNLIKDRLMLDGNEKQNLATFCTTWSEPEVDELMKLGSVKNLIDKELYPETAKIEVCCTKMLAGLWHAPDVNNSIGTSCVGSSEAAMLGGLALKRNWQQKRKAKGLDTSKPNLVTGPVQICWKKFCTYFEIEHREVPIREGALCAHPDDMVNYIDENTIGVVPTFGTTFTLVYEDVLGLSNALDKLQKERGLDIPIHVDAASGSFIAPFVEEQSHIVWDFRLPRVKSINSSGHKYGLAPLGLGWVVWREKQDLPDDLVFYVNYLGGNMATFALNFSRPGGSVIAQYYQLLRLGKEGYSEIQQTCVDTGKFLAHKLADFPEFEMLYSSEGGLPGVVFTLKDDVKGFTLYDLQNQVKQRGWQTAAYPLPSNRQNTIIMRVLIRYGVSTTLMNLLAQDIRNIVDQLKANATTHESVLC